MHAMIDPVRDLVRKKLKETGQKPRQVSLLLKRNHAYIQQYLERGTPDILPEDVRGTLAHLLGVKEWELRPNGSPSSSRWTPKAPDNPAEGLSDTIPVLGMAQGGEDGWALWNGDVVAYIPRPAVLSGVPKAYAVYTVGHSMVPRYNPGETLYINPSKPPPPGQHVLLELHPKDGDAEPRAMVKQLVRRSGSKTTLHQYNPDKTFDIPNDQIKSMHRVVGTSET